MGKFLMRDIELQDKKLWKTIAIGVVYFCSTVLLLKIGMYFLELPILLANEYNISIDEVSSLYGNNYIGGMIGIILIAVLAFPVYIALNKIKRRRKRWGGILS